MERSLYDKLSIPHLQLRSSAIGCDSEELVEHILRIVFGFQLLQFWVVVAEDVFGNFVILLPVRQSQASSIIQTYTYIVVSVEHDSSFLTSYARTSLDSAARLLSVGLNFLLEHVA